MASFDLRWRASTRKDLRGIPSETTSRIIAAAARLADEPLPHGSQKLAGSERTYRIRVGDYRIVYELLREAKIIEIQRVRHRKDVLSAMKITRQITADEIVGYLHGKVSQAELVDWAERAMMEADFEEAEVLSDIIGRLGLADVAAVTQSRHRGTRPGFQFGLRWQDCEEFLRRLGYRATVTVSRP